MSRVPVAAREAGDYIPIRSVDLGSIGVKGFMPEEVCAECGVICTDLYAELHCGGGIYRTYCLWHARRYAVVACRLATRRPHEPAA